jgi:hypothetical protein
MTRYGEAFTVKNLNQYYGIYIKWRVKSLDKWDFDVIAMNVTEPVQYMIPN